MTNEKARDSGVKPRSAAQTPAKSAASDASQLASFMRISLVLTGAKTLDADLAEAYFQSARGNLSAKLDALLTHFDDLVTNGRDPGVPWNENLYELVEGRVATPERMPDRLPRTLIEALDSFRTDKLVATSLGEGFRDIYLRQKTKEWERDFYKVSNEERLLMMEHV